MSGFAQGVSMLAIPWYFADVLDESSTFGVIYGVATFFILFWGLYVGTLIDKYSRKKIFLLINLLGGLIIGSIAIVGYALGSVPTPLVGLAFCTTLFIYNVHYPTLYAFGQEITEKKNYGKINSIIEVQGQAISVLSGAFAALLITGVNDAFLVQLGVDSFIDINIDPWSLQSIFLMDASTYTLAFVLIFFIKYRSIKEKKVDSGHIVERFKQGASFLKKVPLVFNFGLCSYAIFAALLIHIHQIMPIYISNHLHSNAAVYAGAETLYALGALFAGVGIRWFFKNTNTVLAIVIMMLLSASVFTLLAFTKSAMVLIVVCFILGLTNAGTRVLRVTYLFNHIPNHLIGRATSVFRTLNIIARFSFICLFSLTFFAESNNIKLAYFIFGVFIFISIVPLLIHYKKLVNLNVTTK